MKLLLLLVCCCIFVLHYTLYIVYGETVPSPTIYSSAKSLLFANFSTLQFEENFVRADNFDTSDFCIKFFDTGTEYCDGISSDFDSKYQEIGLTNLDSKTTLNPQNNIVEFSPPSLDFGDTPLCTLKTLSFSLMNKNPKENLTVSTITSDFLSFQLAFKSEAVNIPYNSKVIGEISFLPKTIEKADSTFSFKTNFGFLTFRVRGTGVDSPYHLKPILNQRVHIDTEFKKYIFVYNPHADRLVKLREAKSSEKFFILSMPDLSTDDLLHDNFTDGNRYTKPPAPYQNIGHWDVAPFQTKPVLVVLFNQKNPGKYQGLIHLISNEGSFAVHIEIDVVKPGVQKITEELRFGTLIHSEEKVEREIVLINNGPKYAKILDIYLQNDNDQIQIQFKKGLILQENVSQSVAKVTFSGKRQGDFSGKVIIKTNDTMSSQHSQKLEIPYSARVLHGNIEYIQNSTLLYVSNSEEKIEQQLVLINHFSVPIEIKSVLCLDQQRFSIINADKLFPTVVDVNHSMEPIMIQYWDKNNRDPLFDSFLIIDTNIGKLSISLSVFHGKLEYLHLQQHLIQKFLSNMNKEEVFAQLIQERSRPILSNVPNDVVFMGIVNLNEDFVYYVTLFNPNPVNIKLYYTKVQTQLKNVNMKIAATCSLNGTCVLPTSSTIEASTISPKQFVILELKGQSVTEVASADTEIYFFTSHRPLVLKLRYSCLQGMLDLAEDRVIFEEIFPGKAVRKAIRIRNRYSSTIKIHNLLIADSRFSTSVVAKEVPSQNERIVGHVIFNTSKLDDKENYLLSSPFHNYNRYGYLKTAVSKEEINDFRWRNARWQDTVQKEQNLLQTYLLLQSELISVLNVSIIGRLVKPRVINDHAIHFDATAIGSRSETMLILHNPSDSPMTVQPFFTDEEFVNTLNQNSEYDLPTQIREEEQAQLKKKERDASVPESVMMTIKDENIPSQMVGTPEHDGTTLKYQDFSLKLEKKYITLLPKSELVIGPLSYAPSSALDAQCYLVLRNNFTLFDYIKVSGISGYSHLTFLDPLHKSDTAFVKFEVAEMEIGFWDKKRKHFYLRDVFNTTKKTSSTTISPQQTFARLGSNYNAQETTLSEKPKEIIFTKSFTLINKGNMPIKVKRSSIEKFGCQAYGVKLHTCGSFEMLPKEQFEYKISYRPDFTTSKFQLLLHMFTNDSSSASISFPIVITLPHELLPLLHGMQQTTFTENVIHIVSTGFVFLGLLYLILKIRKDVMLFILSENKDKKHTLSPSTTILPSDDRDIEEVSQKKSGTPTQTKTPSPIIEDEFDFSETAKKKSHKESKRKKKHQKLSPTISSIMEEEEGESVISIEQQQPSTLETSTQQEIQEQENSKEQEAEEPIKEEEVETHTTTVEPAIATSTPILSETTSEAIETTNESVTSAQTGQKKTKERRKERRRNDGIKVAKYVEVVTPSTTTSSMVHEKDSAVDETSTISSSSVKSDSPFENLDEGSQHIPKDEQLNVGIKTNFLRSRERSTSDPQKHQPTRNTSSTVPQHNRSTHHKPPMNRQPPPVVQANNSSNKGHKLQILSRNQSSKSASIEASSTVIPSLPVVATTIQPTVSPIQQAQPQHFVPSLYTTNNTATPPSLSISSMGLYGTSRSNTSDFNSLWNSTVTSASSSPSFLEPKSTSSPTMMTTSTSNSPNAMFGSKSFLQSQYPQPSSIAWYGVGDKSPSTSSHSPTTAAATSLDIGAKKNSPVSLTVTTSSPTTSADKTVGGNPAYNWFLPQSQENSFFSLFTDNFSKSNNNNNTAASATTISSTTATPSTQLSSAAAALNSLSSEQQQAYYSQMLNPFPQRVAADSLFSSSPSRFSAIPNPFEGTTTPNHAPMSPFHLKPLNTSSFTNSPPLTPTSSMRALYHAHRNSSNSTTPSSIGNSFDFSSFELEDNNPIQFSLREEDDE